MRKDLTTSEGVLKESKRLFKRADIKEKIKEFLAGFAIAGVCAFVLSALSAMGVAIGEDNMLDNYSKTQTYQEQFLEDVEQISQSDGESENVNRFNSYEYKEECLLKSGDEKLTKKYTRLKKAKKALLIVTAASAGTALLSWPAYGIVGYSQENDTKRSWDYTWEAQRLAKKEEEEGEYDDYVEAEQQN